MSNPEVLKTGGENNVEVQGAAAERSKELLKNAESSVEQSPEKQAERAAEARVEAHKEALMSKETGGAEKRGGGEPTGGPALTHATKAQRKSSYKSTMDQIRSEMSTPSRSFSKVIHNRAVEKVSDAVGSTIARPNAILAGSFTAALFTLAIYVFAKHYGYELSGFETIGGFIIGWAVGLIYDYARLLISGGRRS